MNDRRKSFWEEAALVSMSALMREDCAPAADELAAMAADYADALTLQWEARHGHEEAKEAPEQLLAS